MVLKLRFCAGQSTSTTLNPSFMHLALCTGAQSALSLQNRKHGIIQNVLVRQEISLTANKGPKTTLEIII